jgi:hypothetical protein
VRAIVTDRAVIERLEPGGGFVLTGVLSQAGAARETLIQDAVGGCGWPLPMARHVELFPPVDGRELAAVRTFDPTGNFVL